MAQPSGAKHRPAGQIRMAASIGWPSRPRGGWGRPSGAGVARGSTMPGPRLPALAIVSPAWRSASRQQADPFRTLAPARPALCRGAFTFGGATIELRAAIPSNGQMARSPPRTPFAPRVTAIRQRKVRRPWSLSVVGKGTATRPAVKRKRAADPRGIGPCHWPIPRGQLDRSCPRAVSGFAGTP
jgi:hypothetical protein